MDKDGDGILSLYELEYFYEEVLDKLDEMNIESLSVENTICQVLDMINPREPGKITLKDLKTNQLAPIFLNTFVNMEKYLEFEQKEPVNTSKVGTNCCILHVLLYCTTTVVLHHYCCIQSTVIALLSRLLVRVIIKM